MNEDFMTRLKDSPELFAALQDPQMNQALQEMGKNPKEAMEKYG
jgi:hypothetical protein